MLLRISIEKTRRFFHKTIESIKSFMSGGYEKLPKTPSFNPCSCTGADPNSLQSFRELENFCRDLSNRWNSTDPDKVGKHRNKMKSPQQQSPVKVRNEEKRRTELGGREMRRAHHSHGGGGGEIGSDYTHSERNVREKGGQLVVVVQKLKELEMMDANDMEHVLDIEEILHYYSRLTCPAYLDIVDKFFMSMYSEFFLPDRPSSASSSSAAINNFSRSHRF